MADLDTLKAKYKAAIDLGKDLGVSWKNLGLSFLLSGQWGAQVYNQTRAFACRDYRCAEADQAGKPDSEKKPVSYYGVAGVYARNENNSWFVENGDFVKSAITPLAVFGPYRAAPGPRTTSIRSMSSFVVVERYGMFTRNDGTNAKRLSVNVINAPEKILLNPRATMFDLTSPPRATSMP